ncbi:MAG: flavodoxin domain-containing protein [Spirochaetaceae bacterium]|nr:flavodoxin domain-containing protein [Spirochaetaceae bacterium]
MRICVAYASRTGTTREIAENIAAILREQQAEVIVTSVSAVESVREYDLLILGSPINGMKALPEFRDFLEKKVVGSEVPSHIFIVSYIYPQGRPFWRRVIEKELETLQRLAGATSGMIFGGRLPQAMPGFARMIFGTPADAPLDIRDWHAIEDWARQLIS